MMSWFIFALFAYAITRWVSVPYFEKIAEGKILEWKIKHSVILLLSCAFMWPIVIIIDIVLVAVAMMTFLTTKENSKRLLEKIHSWFEKNSPV